MSIEAARCRGELRLKDTDASIIRQRLLAATATSSEANASAFCAIPGLALLPRPRVRTASAAPAAPPQDVAVAATSSSAAASVDWSGKAELHSHVGEPPAQDVAKLAEPPGATLARPRAKATAASYLAAADGTRSQQAFGGVRGRAAFRKRALSSFSPKIASPAKRFHASAWPSNSSSPFARSSKGSGADQRPRRLRRPPQHWFYDAAKGQEREAERARQSDRTVRLPPQVADEWDEPTWKRFTPSKVDMSKCMARTWAGGRGGQCGQRPSAGTPFCAAHLRGKGWRGHGRVDGPIPAAKLKEFLDAPVDVDELRRELAALQEQLDSATSAVAAADGEVTAQEQNDADSSAGSSASAPSSALVGNGGGASVEATAATATTSSGGGRSASAGPPAKRARRGQEPSDAEQCLTAEQKRSLQEKLDMFREENFKRVLRLLEKEFKGVDQNCDEVNLDLDSLPYKKQLRFIQFVEAEFRKLGRIPKGVYRRR
eukprot:TRINITY_DN18224_c0_g1_i1.p1 TRINITY_DN18224_c0_g1~~TRINITY_DN18224_c0_g1_i1.p1  ORF type:complete len:488 (-),score=94.34 TRINITY_DN18224_c0_g1_i1:73-1536(-)